MRAAADVRQPSRKCKKNKARIKPTFEQLFEFFEGAAKEGFAIYKTRAISALKRGTGGKWTRGDYDFFQRLAVAYTCPLSTSCGGREFRQAHAFYIRGMRTGNEGDREALYCRYLDLAWAIFRVARVTLQHPETTKFYNFDDNARIIMMTLANLHFPEQMREWQAARADFEDGAIDAKDGIIS